MTILDFFITQLKKKLAVVAAVERWPFMEVRLLLQFMVFHSILLPSIESPFRVVFTANDKR